MLDRRGCGQQQLLQELLGPASELARPPISSYKVGAVGITDTGNVYFGVNLEFPGVPLNNSVHAEQFLVANLRMHGESKLELVALNAAPCGHCRQFFSELSCADTVAFMLPGDARHDATQQPLGLAELLPQRFAPRDLLGDAHPPLLLDRQNLALAYSEDASAMLKERAADSSFGDAAEAALSEAKESYAPYTRCPCGVAITTDAGMHCGAYLESAAYNPGMLPLQVALVSGIVKGLVGYSDIREVVVAELEGAPVQQAPTIKLLLCCIAPEASVTVLHVVRLD